MNKVMIIGRLTDNPELRYSGNNNAVATFTVAVDRGKDKNGEKLGADFPRVVAFGRAAENMERYSAKGLRVAVDGHIRTGSYTKNDGTKVYTTEVYADRVEFIDFKETRTNNGAFDWGGFESIDDDLPF